LPLWAVLNKLLGLYDRDAVMIDKSTLHELPRIVESVVIGGGLIFLLAPVAGLDAHRHQALEFSAVATGLTAAARWVTRRLVLRVFGPERAVIVGSGRVARLLARSLL